MTTSQAPIAYIPTINEVLGFSHLAGNPANLSNNINKSMDGRYPVEVHFKFGGFIREYGQEKDSPRLVLLMVNLKGIVDSVLVNKETKRPIFHVADYNPKRETIQLSGTMLKEIQEITSGDINNILGKISYTNGGPEIFLGTSLNNLRLITS